MKIEVWAQCRDGTVAKKRIDLPLSPFVGMKLLFRRVEGKYVEVVTYTIKDVTYDTATSEIHVDLQESPPHIEEVIQHEGDWIIEALPEDL